MMLWPRILGFVLGIGGIIALGWLIERIEIIHTLEN